MFRYFASSFFYGIDDRVTPSLVIISELHIRMFGFFQNPFSLPNRFCDLAPHFLIDKSPMAFSFQLSDLYVLLLKWLWLQLAFVTKLWDLFCFQSAAFLFQTRASHVLFWSRPF